MMKKFITTVAIVALFANCGGASKTNENAEKPVVETAKPVELIKDVDNYFVTYKPKMVEVLIQGKEDFEANFNPAATMDAQPTEVDFTVHKVGAIVAPETEVETNIVINETSIVDRKLVVDYSINTKGEKRSFTIVPIKLFKYGTMMEIDSVSFVRDGVATTLPK